MFTRPVGPESILIQVASSPEVFIVVSVPHYLLFKNQHFNFSYILQPQAITFPTSYHVNVNEFGHAALMTSFFQTAILSISSHRTAIK